MDETRKGQPDFIDWERVRETSSYLLCLTTIVTGKSWHDENAFGGNLPHGDTFRSFVDSILKYSSKEETAEVLQKADELYQKQLEEANRKVPPEVMNFAKKLLKERGKEMRPDLSKKIKPN